MTELLIWASRPLERTAMWFPLEKSITLSLKLPDELTLSRLHTFLKIVNKNSIYAWAFIPA